MTYYVDEFYDVVGIMYLSVVAHLYLKPDESSFECIPDVFDVVVVPSSALRFVELVGLLPVLGDDPDTIDS